MDIQNKPTLEQKQEFWKEQLPNFEAEYWLPSHFEFLVFDMDQGNYVIKDDLDPNFEDDADEIWHRVNTGWVMWLRAKRAKTQATSNLRFERDDDAVWVFSGDSQQGTEISHLITSHIDDYSEDDVRLICHYAANEIDRLRAELAKAIPEGFVLVHKELPEHIAESMALERVEKPVTETDPTWIKISEDAYKGRIQSKKWELWRDYKAMIEAQEQGDE